MFVFTKHWNAPHQMTASAEPRNQFELLNFFLSHRFFGFFFRSPLLFHALCIAIYGVLDNERFALFSRKIERWEVSNKTDYYRTQIGLTTSIHPCGDFDQEQKKEMKIFDTHTHIHSHTHTHTYNVQTHIINYVHANLPGWVCVMNMCVRMTWMRSSLNNQFL